MKKTFVVLFTVLLTLHSSAAVRIPSIFNDGMVLQRNEPIRLWGWADPREEFTIVWKGRKHNVTAGDDGRWEHTLAKQKAGGPYVLNVGGKEITDIMIGDVFLCSGQSNMELPVRRVTDMFAEEIESYSNADIRHYIVPKVFDFNAEQEDTKAAQWKKCEGKDVMEFSALAYFFAKALHGETGVAVGIVNASWGSTPVEAWMSERALADFPRQLHEKKMFEDEEYRRKLKEVESMSRQRWDSILKSSDPGLVADVKWYSAEYDHSGWKEVEMLSKDWGNNGLNACAGSHWLRKTFIVDKEHAGKEAVLRLGCIKDSDSAYINGKYVGSTGYEYPPRIYRIPEGVLKEGVNTVTVRIVSNGGQPKFVPEKPYKVICEGQEISLEGKWFYRQGADMPSSPSSTFLNNKPVGLYNAMISPLRKFAFKGVVWYQGESNVGRRIEYAALLTEMIKDWRNVFGDEDLPFYIVELADFMHKSNTYGRGTWQKMREEQAKAADAVPDAHLIKNSDLGEWNDIHPLDKKTLGQRVKDAVMKN